MEAKKAIVTGASRGIGRGIAWKLASLGYELVISYNTNGAEAEDLVEKIQSTFGTKCTAFQAALDHRGEGKALVAKAIETMGGLDLLVNNAGLCRMTGILDMPEEEMDQLVELDFKNYILMTQAAAHYMVENGIRGSVVNITSSRGERAYPGDAIYGGMKAALNRAIQSLAIELGPYGIRVNNVAPGFTKVRTPEQLKDLPPEWAKHYDENYDIVGHMIPLSRYGTPADIANAVAFLASDEASYITGITIRVDGGLILPGMPESPSIEHNVRGWGYHDHYGVRRKKQEATKTEEKGDEKK